MIIINIIDYLTKIIINLYNVYIIYYTYINNNKLLKYNTIKKIL